MKCIVTGAAGFIGNKLVNRLKKDGYDVIGLIHKNQPKEKVKDVKYKNCDITDRASVEKAFEKCDFVFHCAAYVKDYGPKDLFYKINYEGTKNIYEESKKYNIKKFVFLSHIIYESEEKFSMYSKTKMLSENFLLEKFKENDFPVTIIRPGNVYGPGATTWVLRPVNSIKNNRVTLIEHGNGIFLHTYVDNLIDAIVSVLKNEVNGEVIDITDGDNSHTWGDYLNKISEMCGKGKIKRNLSKRQAMIIAKLMMLLNKIFKIKPWVTPMAVNIFTNTKNFDIDKARDLLDYKPKIDYTKGISNVEKWLKKEGYI